jgi:hypothetical protein
VHGLVSNASVHKLARKHLLQNHSNSLVRNNWSMFAPMLPVAHDAESSVVSQLKQL